jgi:hypothetical protein
MMVSSASSLFSFLLKDCFVCFWFAFAFFSKMMHQRFFSMKYKQYLQEWGPFSCKYSSKKTMCSFKKNKINGNTYLQRKETWRIRSSRLIKQQLQLGGEASEKTKYGERETHQPQVRYYMEFSGNAYILLGLPLP